MPGEDIMEQGMRPLPRAADVQQTLVNSFTIGGVGLHTGEYATVRVRPAFAGEGRYFVRVPRGTNAELFELQSDVVEVPEEALAEAAPTPDAEHEAAKVELYMKYLHAKENEGYDDTFVEFLRAANAEPLSAGERRALKEAIALAAQVEGEDVDADGVKLPDEVEPEEEEPVAMDRAAEVITPANVMFAEAEEGVPFVTLHSMEGGGEEPDHIINPTLLLSALEACGVDNARIEIEGGHEVPVLDNSALGWVLNIQQCGVRTAPFLDAAAAAAAAEEAPDGEQAWPRRLALVPSEGLVVQRGEAFIALHPGPFTKLTAGVDAQDAAAIIGQQWYSWRPLRDYHYRYELAPARGWVDSVDALFELRSSGFGRNASEGLFVIGHGTRWWDPSLVRFHDDEPTRHQLALLVGALALVAGPGHTGLPTGHVVAFNADASLMVEFAKALLKSCENEGQSAIDCATLLRAQVALAEEEAAAREARGGPRRARDAALADLGGPAVAGTGQREELEQDGGEGEGEEQRPAEEA